MPFPLEVDVESIMIQLRSAGREGGGALFGAAGGASHSAKRDAISTHLAEEERSADVGTVVPGFERFGRVLRKAARFTSRVVMYLAKVVTVPQRRVNFALLQAARGILGCLKDEEAARLELQARVQLLEQTVSALRGQIESAAKTTHEADGPHWHVHRQHAASHQR